MYWRIIRIISGGRVRQRGLVLDPFEYTWECEELATHSAISPFLPFFFVVAFAMGGGEEPMYSCESCDADHSKYAWHQKSISIPARRLISILTSRWGHSVGETCLTSCVSRGTRGAQRRYRNAWMYGCTTRISGWFLVCPISSYH